MGYRYLTQTNVKAIKRALVAGTSLTNLAEKYGSSMTAIFFIADNRTWTEIKVAGWKKFLKLRQAKKKLRKVRKAKKLALTKPKKKKISVTRRKAVKLNVAPKRPDHATWEKQFDQPKVVRKKRALKAVAEIVLAAPEETPSPQIVPQRVILRKKDGPIMPNE